MKKLYAIITTIMSKLKRTKDGSLDMRYKENQKIKEEQEKIQTSEEQAEHHATGEFVKEDPNELFQRLLKQNNLKLDFDVVDGTITTHRGILKLEKPQLIIEAKYVTKSK